MQDMETRMRHAEKSERRAMSWHFSRSPFYCLHSAFSCSLLIAFFLLSPAAFLAEQPTTQEPKSPGIEEQGAPLPGDWAPELLDAILSSPNPEAHDALYRAAFAAGRVLVPQLEAALKDDRTAEFAAQALAFIGGEKALEILWKLVRDPRDLNLKRFYYGALGEFDSPEAIQTLFDVIARSDAEPDRTVTEAAVLALTVRSDLKLVPRLREAAAKLQDVVIRDDLDNTLAVIESRAKYLASPEGKTAGGSVERAVQTYFHPALEPPPVTTPKSPAGRSAAAIPLVQVKIENLTLSPDKTRALARVAFEDPSARAEYDIVLQKQYGDWSIASVWLGSEVEKPAPTRAPSVVK